MKIPSPSIAPTTRRRFLGAAGIVAGHAITRPLFGQNSASQQVHFGLIGVGNRGSTHLKVLLTQPGARIVAVCDEKPERIAAAQELVVAAGQPKPFGTTKWNPTIRRVPLSPRFRRKRRTPRFQQF